MTATQTQIRRDTAANLAGVTPALSELGHDVTNDRLVIGNGSTQGGILLPKAVDLISNYFTAATATNPVSVNALILDLPLNAPAYTVGMVVRFKAAATNTGAATINVDGLGVKNIYKISGGTIGALVAGDIINGGMYEIAYDGTQFQLLNVEVPDVSAAGWEFISAANALSASVVDFTSGISSTYKNYAMLFNNLRASGVSSTQLWMRMSDGGTGGFYSSTGNYAHQRSELNGTTRTESNSNSDTKIVLTSNQKYLNSMGFTGQAIISQFSGRRPSVTWYGGSNDWDNGGGGYHSIGQGYCKGSNTSQLDGIRLQTESQEFSEGQVLLFGIRES